MATKEDRAKFNPRMFPVMLTPFTEEGEVDYPALEKLIEFYERGGADGLFSVCQSSEVFYLSLKERVEIASFVKQHAHVPVVASGHVSCSPTEQIRELNLVAETGVDAIILITNRLANKNDPPDQFMRSLDFILDNIDASVPLGFYECPVPYKRLIGEAELGYAASTGRFLFMKDTCCDLETLSKRIKLLSGSKMGLYNANTATLLDSLNLGASGYSGIMASFHPELYAWLLKNHEIEPEKAKNVQAFLTICALIERQYYPINAKYYLNTIKGLPITTYSRMQSKYGLSELFKDEILQLERLTNEFKLKENLL